ncbi:conserved hypothetical protein [Flavobacterium sp. 9AF]|uniref:hypothetical protein n=1 Tax=Flavobacterium sp. 9AF TaxID=2653142 RepID=UPI0012F04B17|nr:hypothetical protein [Flavobacterium sp. 9AF]VXB97181.1 conserved hypothetical protein [Flavobacterium sp. 9AF]
MILVFKTSVRTLHEIQKIKPLLNKLFSYTKWNFDLEDCDNIFRIDSPLEISDEVITIFNENGHECIALED